MGFGRGEGLGSSVVSADEDAELGEKGLEGRADGREGPAGALYRDILGNMVIRVK